MNFRAMPSMVRAMLFKFRIILQAGVESFAFAYHAPFRSYYSDCILDYKNVTWFLQRSCFSPSASIQSCLHRRVSHHQLKRKYSALQSIVFWLTDTSIHQCQCLTPLVLSVQIFLKKIENAIWLGGHSQNYFTCSSIKILVHCYQLWRMFIEICGTIGKQVIKI